jgi:hypothetical protein
VVGNGSGARTMPPPVAPRRGVPVPASPSGLPARRRWGRVALGGLLALLGAWLCMILVATAGGREEMLALADDVARGDQLQRDDLTIVRVAADAAVETIPASDLDEVVGSVVGSDLPQGALLARAHLLDAGERVVSTDEAVVGARLGPGDAPPGEVSSGTPIMVVVRSAQTTGESTEATEVRGWLRDLGEPHENTGAREASLVVPTSSAATVAAAAADERIAVVILEEAGG